MSARVKPAPVLVIHNLEQANATLAEMAILKRGLVTIETDMNNAIDAIKRSAEGFSAPRRVRVKELEQALSVYAEINRATLFVERRSVELGAGEFGYRASTELKPRPKLTWAMVLEKIVALGLAALRTRTEVDREALRDWPDERLEVIGVQRVQKDLFWYEIKQETLPKEG